MTSPDNTDRAGWAQAAADAYAELTRFVVQEQAISFAPDDQDGKERAEEVIGDLLGDLRHLCRKFGLDFDALSEQGAMHFRDEVAEEAMKSADDTCADDPEGKHAVTSGSCDNCGQKNFS